jgi:hypothetical protein
VPYTPDQLAAIARTLGCKKDNALVRSVVGIARAYMQQKACPPQESAAALRNREEEVARAAKQAAALLDRLDQLYRKPYRGGWPGCPLMVAPLYQLDAWLRGGDIKLIAGRLAEFAKKTSKRETALRGRRPDNAAITALTQLMVVWKEMRGTRRGRQAFLDTAMEPLDYWPSRNVREEHMKAARALLSPRKSK